MEIELESGYYRSLFARLWFKISFLKLHNMIIKVKVIYRRNSMNCNIFFLELNTYVFAYDVYIAISIFPCQQNEHPNREIRYYGY